MNVSTSRPSQEGRRDEKGIQWIPQAHAKGSRWLKPARNVCRQRARGPRTHWLSRWQESWGALVEARSLQTTPEVAVRGLSGPAARWRLGAAAAAQRRRQRPEAGPPLTPARGRATGRGMTRPPPPAAARPRPGRLPP